jgi:fluoride exporter
VTAEPTLATALGVAGAGAVGSVARWLVAVWTSRWSGFPWGTLAVNVVGALAIGLIVAALGTRDLLDSRWRPVLVTGLLGGFTTFSAFAYETIELAERRQLGTAAIYVLVTIVAGLAACWLGLRAR